MSPVLFSMKSFRTVLSSEFMKTKAVSVCGNFSVNNHNLRPIKCHAQVYGAAKRAHVEATSRNHNRLFTENFNESIRNAFLNLKMVKKWKTETNPFEVSQRVRVKLKRFMMCVGVRPPVAVYMWPKGCGCFHFSRSRFHLATYHSRR